MWFAKGRTFFIVDLKGRGLVHRLWLEGKESQVVFLISLKRVSDLNSADSLWAKGEKQWWPGAPTFGISEDFIGTPILGSAFDSLVCACSYKGTKRRFLLPFQPYEEFYCKCWFVGETAWASLLSWKLQPCPHSLLSSTPIWVTTELVGTCILWASSQV